MAIDTGLGAILILVGRLLFGGFLAFQGLDHFMNTDEMPAMRDRKECPPHASA